ncbi:DNA-directed RNA polymerase 1 kda [Grosmannia clavigera kw1407]|uniref:DNA-directed RNA polymerase subunit n=1 Tax=Grosmannia clavigera (strain kw1407 / UAMH 11150) TaxID=655863 RepID=F0XI16_GROCL|nr:DNA-directed RNA polymerase 1 kda [Grosmannia clavigera kw1407]EFX02751.1 DNA-directed RNA polymerase 1 kda [Grosmannia clavigera kw1407]
MASLGSLVFCTDCGNLLPMSKGSDRNRLVCRCCGAHNQDQSASQTIVTSSNPKDFPSPLRQKLSTTQSVERHKVSTEAVTTETCPKCGRTEVRFTTAQIRSADEGSTVFFHCDCGHRWSENN